MDVKSELKKVYTNRLLQFQKDISSFEEAIGNNQKFEVSLDFKTVQRV